MIFLGLFLFGIAYNAFVAWLERAALDRGYTAILVVVGTLVTLGGYALLAGWEQALTVLLCFVASGTPMIAGSIWRYVTRRQQEEKSLETLVRELLGDVSDDQA
jgi:ACR3 family arsenite efflux pump ArsB